MKRHALFVGVDQYADGHIPNLSCAVSDATDLHGFFKYGAGYDRVVLLRNPAVKQDVLDAVQDLTSGLENGDFFLFFFAGHGFRVGENHILVCNRDRYDDVKHEDAGLRLGQLKRRLSGSFDSALFLDACQSDILATRGGEGIAERDLSLIHETQKDEIRGGALTIVTSCDAGQTAAELSEVRHGLFTMAMLDLLKESQRAHTQIDLSDTFRRRLGRRMGEIAARSGLSTEQRPRFSCTGDSCVILLDGSDSAVDDHRVAEMRRIEEEKRIAAIREKEDRLAREERRLREEKQRQDARLQEERRRIEEERRQQQIETAAKSTRMERVSQYRPDAKQGNLQKQPVNVIGTHEGQTDAGSAKEEPYHSYYGLKRTMEREWEWYCRRGKWWRIFPLVKGFISGLMWDWAFTESWYLRPAFLIIMTLFGVCLWLILYWRHLLEME